jgi:hypothetical protein
VLGFRGGRGEWRGDGEFRGRGGRGRGRGDRGGKLFSLWAVNTLIQTSSLQGPTLLRLLYKTVLGMFTDGVNYLRSNLLSFDFCCYAI